MLRERRKYLHTSGTWNVYDKIIKKSYFFSVMCLMCAYNVPDVCTYLGVLMSQKYGPRRFQRRVARLSTTKTRPCSAGQSAATLGRIGKL